MTLQKMLGFIRRADEKYHMIEPGDSVALGISGGKDSMALLYGLAEYRRIKPFTLTGLCVAPEGLDTEKISSLCALLDVPLHILPAGLPAAEEKNPCARCARRRRGMLVKAAGDLHCNALALAHHMDDARQTFLLALTQEGRFLSLPPVSQMERGGLKLIRPLILAEEKDIRLFCSRYAINPVKNPCPFDGKTKRQDAAQMLEMLESMQPDFQNKLATALQNSDFLRGKSDL